MILVQEIHLRDWEWHVTIFYIVDRFIADPIFDALRDIDTEEEDLHYVEKVIGQGTLNTGLTYSNPLLGKSVIVISPTTSAEEFQNTFDHEKVHLAVHIAKCNKLDYESEDFAYLVGDIGSKMFPVAKKFLCDHCRKF